MEKFLEIGEGIPVLIDVLRASSTIITALGNGVKEVIPINSKTNSTNFNKEDYILVGEKNGIKLNGFDIGNSPVDLIKLLKTDKSNIEKKIVIKTTNATNRLCSVSKAYIVSSLNLNYAQVKLKGQKVSLVIAGGNYGVKEDLVVGLALYGHIYGNINFSEDFINNNILNSKARAHLEKLGYYNDVRFIIENINKYNILPVLEEGVIKSQ